jgi:hypothetical protein
VERRAERSRSIALRRSRSNSAPVAVGRKSTPSRAEHGPDSIAPKLSNLQEARPGPTRRRRTLLLPTVRSEGWPNYHCQATSAKMPCPREGCPCEASDRTPLLRPCACITTNAVVAARTTAAASAPCSHCASLQAQILGLQAKNSELQLKTRELESEVDRLVALNPAKHYGLPSSTTTEDLTNCTEATIAHFNRRREGCHRGSA